MIIIQLILYCALFTFMVKIGVGNNALNGLYFYPKPVQKRDLPTLERTVEEYVFLSANDSVLSNLPLIEF